jgi:hypothetical protein
MGMLHTSVNFIATYFCPECGAGRMGIGKQLVIASEIAKAAAGVGS